MVEGTRSGSVIGASSTKNTPSGYDDISLVAASMAKRVFPQPPVPVRVRSRVASKRCRIRANSRSRPTKLVSGAGMVVGISRVFGGGNSDGRPSITS
jgi:hypothetical protein